MASPLEELLRASHYDEALERIDSGELDPASAPSGIYYAVRAEGPEVLRRLLAAGADPNHRSRPRPLQIAAGQGRLANVEVLLEAGADPNAGSTIASPLSDAVGGGHDRVAACLVTAGARDSEHGGSQLVHSAFRGLTATVRAMLVARGAGGRLQAFEDRRLEPEHVLEFFRTHEAVITEVSHNTIAGRFATPPEDPEALAEEVYALCPDTVDQGFGDLELLAEALAEGRFHLWWD